MAKTQAPADVTANEPAPPPAIPEGVAALVEETVKAYLDANLADLVKAALPPTPGPADTEGLSTQVLDIIKPLLPDLVKDALPPTPEQVQQRERESAEQAVLRQRQAAERRARAQQRAADKAAAALAEEQAKRDAEARKAFENATPFIGDVRDLKANIIRAVMVDDGQAYSADHVFKLIEGDVEPTIDGGLMLLKAIELPANGRAFDVTGINLVTDAGRMRLEIGGKRTVGGGKAVQFPTRSLIFRPEPAAQD